MRFRGRGHAGSAVTIAVFLAAFLLAGAIEAQIAPSRGWTVALVAAGIPVVLALGWLISAKLAGDLAEARAENERARRLEGELNRRFAAAVPASTYDEEAFAELVEEELAALPSWIAAAIREHNVALTVDEERPGEPRTLGLYRVDGGTSEIILYRLAILRAAGPGRLRRVVHDTLLHELGHLFGMSETDLDRYSIGNNPRPDAEPVHPPRGRPSGGLRFPASDPEPGNPASPPAGLG
jgi:predicted Zn-dependent protease with MMP-like domain